MYNTSNKQCFKHSHIQAQLHQASETFKQGSHDTLIPADLTTTTLLFWNDRKCSKLISHCPELGIPIMTVNDGYTKSTAFFHLAKSMDLCQLCVSLKTSQTLKDPADNLHFIPIEDEEAIFRRLQQVDDSCQTHIYYQYSNLEKKKQQLTLQGLTFFYTFNTYMSYMKSILLVTSYIAWVVLLCDWSTI